MYIFLREILYRLINKQYNGWFCWFFHVLRLKLRLAEYFKLNTHNILVVVEYFSENHRFQFNISIAVFSVGGGREV